MNGDGKKRSPREVAWRVFAAEYNTSSMEFKDGEGEKIPTYVVTPLGALINRLFIVGVITDLQNIGTEQEPLWRAMISDSTGQFYVYAGKYAPEATLALSKIQPPAFVAIIGKSRTYSPQEGTIYMSVRPEKIVVVDEGIRDYWILETARATLCRIDAIEEAREMGSPTVEGLTKLGYPHALAEGVIKSLDHYKEVDLNRFRGMVLEALEQLLPERSPELALPAEMPAATGPEEIEDDEEDKEELLLKLIDKLDKTGKGAPMTELEKEAGKSGIGKDEFEELSNSLLDKGLIYEPVIGKMKRI